MDPKKKSKKKKQAKFRHPSRLRKIQRDVAKLVKWLQEPDNPRRQEARGIVGDMREFGAAPDKIAIPKSTEAVDDSLLELLNSPNEDSKYRGLRVISQFQAGNLKAREQELELAAEAMKAQAAEVQARLQAKLEEMEARGAGDVLTQLNKLEEAGQ